MRYYIKTFKEHENEYFVISAKTNDFDDFLKFKLNQFPQYIAPISTRKWLRLKITPEIFTYHTIGSKRLVTDEPIVIYYPDILSGHERILYREKLLDLLMEWLDDAQNEFQSHWKSLTTSI